MSDASGRPGPDPDTLVLRAAFVPDGKQPPPEFMADLSPLHFPVTLDPATGEITCEDAGMGFDGGVKAAFYPDENQGSAEESAATDQTQADRGG